MEERLIQYPAQEQQKQCQNTVSLVCTSTYSVHISMTEYVLACTTLGLDVMSCRCTPAIVEGMPVHLTWPIWGQVRQQTQACLASEVQAYTTRAISRTSLFITKRSGYILRRYQYVLVCTQYIQVCTDMHQIQTIIYLHIMKYYRCTPHGDQRGVLNPSLAGQVKITV